MSGFIPEGFEKIDEYAKVCGPDKIGAQLAAGKVEAFRLNPSGEIFPIGREVWRGRMAVDILSFGRINGRFLGKYAPERGDLVLVRLPKVAAPKPVPISRPKLVHSASEEAPSRHVGGAPLKHDWAAAAGWIVGYLVEHDYPKTKSEAVGIAIQWFEKQGKWPDKRDVERFVGAIYEARQQFNGKTGKT